MFEQPVVRVSVEDGRAERVGSGPTVDYSLISLSRDGAAAGVQGGRARGRWATWSCIDVASRRATKLTDVNPELHELRAGRR